MTFIDHSPLGDAPKRICPAKLGGLLSVFPPGVLVDHERAGYRFRPNGCVDAIAYDPDYCVAPGDVKKDPNHYGPEKDTVLGMIQTAFACSTIGATPDELREQAKNGLSYNLDRSIESDFVTFLTAGATPVGGPFTPVCALSHASQYLATSGTCGRGLIVGPVGWLTQLQNALVWNGKYHTDYVGNIVVATAVDNNTVFALDAAVEIKISDVQLLDEFAPGITTVNDRVVRAEQLYTIAVDSCKIGSVTVTPCV